MKSVDFKWDEWPPSVPRPTTVEWEAAVKRHRKAQELFLITHPEYQGDTGWSLDFDMATCNRAIWWRYFFPNEEEVLTCKVE